jgi:hypothetical protein
MNTCGDEHTGKFANVVPGVLSERHPIPGVTQPGTIQWLNPDAFVSAVDPSTGQCSGSDEPQHCQFGNSGALPRVVPISSGVTSIIRILGFPVPEMIAFQARLEF